MILELYSAKAKDDASGLPDSSTSITMGSLFAKEPASTSGSFINSFSTKEQVCLFIEQNLNQRQCTLIDIDIIPMSNNEEWITVDFKTEGGKSKVIEYFLITRENN